MGLGVAEFTKSSQGWGPGDPVTCSHVRHGVNIQQSYFCALPLKWGI